MKNELAQDISTIRKFRIVQKEGGLHASLDVSSSKKIPTKKFKAALSGKYGEKAKKQALFKKNVLTGRKK